MKILQPHKTQYINICDKCNELWVSDKDICPYYTYFHAKVVGGGKFCSGNLFTYRYNHVRLRVDINGSIRTLSLNGLIKLWNKSKHPLNIKYIDMCLDSINKRIKIIKEILPDIERLYKDGDKTLVYKHDIFITASDYNIFIHHKNEHIQFKYKISDFKKQIESLKYLL